MNISETSDGGFVVAGYTESQSGDVTGYHGSADCWIIRLDKSGNLLWQSALGGSDWDEAKTVLETDDLGFIVAGYTKSTEFPAALIKD